MIAESGPSCNTEEMFDQLVAEYQMPLKRMSFIYLHDMALAEDAVQETFLKVYKGLPNFHGDCSFKTWIMKIGLNTCKDMLKSAWYQHNDRRVCPEDFQTVKEEETEDEEAEALHISMSSVSRRLKRAREKLRDVLKGGQENE